uniref:MutL C-terminal dimerisation domain-containing protein n=1 Tax=Trichuris muris TaxID=70415 RepID=A0A5S6QKI7_TRIMR
MYDFNDKKEGVVKPLQSDVARKLLCGQNIINLSDACKELLENSLDSGATSIEILVEDYGANCLQVSDNGRGIASKDFDLICKPNCTSKLNDLEDLFSLSTFGFRGQALCALSLMSDITITTRSALEPVGHILEFDHSGNMTKKVACARQELLRNLKREFSKLVDIIRTYALIPQDVNLSFVNVNNGKRTKVLSASSCDRLEENIWELFGMSFFQTLVRFAQARPSEDILSDCKVKVEDLSCISEINVNGYLSSANQGRTSKDRQFLFVNNRPCELKVISNAINEVYRRFNSTQYPAYFLHITIPRGFCDINCTPDKRTILITRQNLLEAIIRHSLMTMFEQVAVVSSCSRPNVVNMAVQSSQYGQPKRTILSDTAALNDSSGKSNQLELDYANGSTPASKQYANEILGPSKLSSSLYSYGFKSKATKFEKPTDATAKMPRPTTPPSPLQFDRRSSETVSIGERASLGTRRPKRVSNELPIPKQPASVTSFEASPKAEVQPVKNATRSPASPLKSSDKVSVHTSDGTLLKRTVHTIEVDWEQVKKRAHECNEEESCEWEFAQVISSETSSASSQGSEAGNEVSRMLKRTSFSEMDVVGQFNLGFIITRLDDDLFIIDQHASDEKYNFEVLQKTAIVESQRLVCPIPVEISAYHREVIVQNLDKFIKNGFAIDLSNDNDASVTVTAVPTCYGKTFDRQDFDDLVTRFSKAPSIVHRPAKLREIFASKACRKSIMIGTALRCDEMKRILKNLSTADSPWNCPHGRPTVRHLAKLARS